MTGLTALLDANVLYPARIHDFLLRLANRYLYAPLWSADIHAEWMRSLLADRPDLDPGVLVRTRMAMDDHGKHDQTILGRPVRPPEPIGDLPVLGLQLVVRLYVHGGPTLLSGRLPSRSRGRLAPLIRKSTTPVLHRANSRPFKVAIIA